MTDSGPAPEGAAEQVSAARLYDFLLGGHRNFAADRELGRLLLEADPRAGQIAWANREFLGRAVRHLTRAGISQFLDLGSGIPVGEKVHEIARRVDPLARVAYVDNDPAAIAHARQDLRDLPMTTAVQRDLRDPQEVLSDPEVSALIDLRAPVGLLMVAVLHLVPDSADPAGLVASYASALAPGSCLVLSHPTDQPCPEAAATMESLVAGRSAGTVRIRSRAAIASFFGGFDLLEPGLVHLPLWRPDGPDPEHPERTWIVGGVGRKPGPG